MNVRCASNVLKKACFELFVLGIHVYSDAGQGVDVSRSYFQGQRPDTKLVLENQNSSDPRSRPHEEDMDVGYEDKPLSQTFEGLEQKYLDDIMKLSKEQSDAEDAENVRHKEVCMTLNVPYFP